MKKAILLSSLAICINATTITQLFDAIEKTADYKLDNLANQEMKINKKSVINSLYPKVTLQASAEHFNRYNSMVPLTPTESGVLLKSGESIPFSQNIYRIGFEVSMPIFVKSIYDNKNRMTKLLKATKYQTKIELLKKQAFLVGYVSKLDYLFALKKSLLKQKSSITTTYKALKVGVDVGRIPEFKLLRLEDSLNQINIQLSNIKKNIDETKANIYKLTNIKIDDFISFNSLIVDKGEFISLKPLQEKVKATHYEIKSKQDNFYPKVMLSIKANRAYAKAYNTGDSIDEDFASAGLYISWNIFDKKNGSDIQKAKINLIKNNLQIAKTKKDLEAEIDKIDSSLVEINKQITLTKNSLKLKKELLKGAKVAFRLNRMSVDEYLQYENDLAKTRADLASLIANQNTLKANKALIYGENLKKVFK